MYVGYDLDWFILSIIFLLFMIISFGLFIKCIPSVDGCAVPSFPFFMTEHGPIFHSEFLHMEFISGFGSLHFVPVYQYDEQINCQIRSYLSKCCESTFTELAFDALLWD